MRPPNIGLLFLRILAGATMLIAHGLPKLVHFQEKALNFPDPIGFGSEISLGLVILAEVFCATLLIIGLLTRLACLPLITTMAVAFFITHGTDPFSNKELSFLFLGVYTAILLTGPGKFSLDHYLIWRKS